MKKSWEDIQVRAQEEEEEEEELPLTQAKGTVYTMQRIIWCNQLYWNIPPTTKFNLWNLHLHECQERSKSKTIEKGLKGIKKKFKKYLGS